MDLIQYDFLVIGTGPAGFSAAIEAAKKGNSVAIIEKEEVVGGSCINTGTFPSKTLREAVLYLTGFLQKESYKYSLKNHIELSMEMLVEKLMEVREREHQIIENQLSRNNVELIRGHASLIDNHNIEIKSASGHQIINARNIIIATGSRPKRHKSIDFDGCLILNSTTLLGIKHIPKNMIIIGAGVIGTEYASIFAALGVKVTLLDKGHRPLKSIDHEVGDYFKENFPGGNVNYIPNVRSYEVIKEKSSVKVKIDTEIKSELLTGDILLYALGREANIENLNLLAIGVKMNQYSYIEVNEMFQTSIANIYAVGDVIGWPSLASTAIVQGRQASRHALKIRPKNFPEIFPYGIYSIPEISYVGKTEEELKAEGINYVIGYSRYDELPRGQIAGIHKGFIKLLVHKETREILGVHIIGKGAIEIIHTAQMAMQYNAKIDIFIDNIFNYPTYSEGYQIAALNAENKIKLNK